MIDNQKITNKSGDFYIAEFGGSFYVRGNINAARLAFSEIGRKPPNAYGNFYKREKAGAAACIELLIKHGKVDYINGIRATRGDLRALLEWIKAGKTTATAHTTKGGNLAIVTTF